MDERLVNPGNDFISVLAGGEKAGIFNRQQVLVNTSLLLLAGHETTINLLCNGTLAFIQHPDQWERLKSDKGETLPPLINRATEECLRYDAPVKSIQTHRLGRRGDARQIDPQRGPDPLVHYSGQPGPGKVRPAGRLRHRPLAQPPRCLCSGIHHCLGAGLAR